MWWLIGGEVTCTIFSFHSVGAAFARLFPQPSVHRNTGVFVPSLHDVVHVQHYKGRTQTLSEHLVYVLPQGDILISFLLPSALLSSVFVKIANFQTRRSPRQLGRHKTHSSYPLSPLCARTVEFVFSTNHRLSFQPLPAHRIYLMLTRHPTHQRLETNISTSVTRFWRKRPLSDYWLRHVPLSHSRLQFASQGMLARPCSSGDISGMISGAKLWGVKQRGCSDAPERQE
jgi:hypothetical protein